MAVTAAVLSLLKRGELILLEVDSGSVLGAIRASLPLGPSTANTSVLSKLGHLFGYGENAKSLRDTGMYFSLVSWWHGLLLS